jgi:hypothetical protein
MTSPRSLSYRRKEALPDEPDLVGKDGRQGGGACGGGGLLSFRRVETLPDEPDLVGGGLLADEEPERGEIITVRGQS